MNKFNYIIIFLVMIFMQSCAGSLVSTTAVPKNNRYGDKAQTVISPNYQYSRSQKIVIMPFQATGKDRPESALEVTDKFSLKVMELGLYTIIDKGMVESFYQDHGIVENLTLNKKQLELIKTELGVDLIFYGTANYEYEPGRSSGRTDYYGQYSGSSRGGYYPLDSESLKAVSTATGEVVITSYAKESFCGSLSQEMVYSIKKKVSTAY